MIKLRLTKKEADDRMIKAPRINYYKLIPSSSRKENKNQEGGMKMLAKLYYKKVYDNGNGNMIQILNWKNIYRYEELPVKYKETRNFQPTFCISGPYLEVWGVYKKEYIQIVRGDVISPALFQEVIKTMKQAGERLTQIKREIKQAKKEWEDGEVHEVVI